jgi:hypothetical protein
MPRSNDGSEGMFSFEFAAAASIPSNRMLTHTVFFWLKKSLSPAERAEFERGVKSLVSIPGSRRATMGRPAKTAKREVLDDSYDFALELDFDSIADHDRYQAHASHVKFLAEQKPKWERVRVYDFEIER